MHVQKYANCQNKCSDEFIFSLTKVIWVLYCGLIVSVVYLHGSDRLRWWVNSVIRSTTLFIQCFSHFRQLVQSLLNIVSEFLIEIVGSRVVIVVLK